MQAALKLGYESCGIVHTGGRKSPESTDYRAGIEFERFLQAEARKRTRPDT